MDSLVVYFLEDETEQPKKKEGDDAFLTRFSHTLTDILWITSHYVAFSSEDTINIVEIDDRNGINVIDFLDLPHEDIFWDDRSKRLLVLSEMTLWQTEPLF